MLIVNNSRQPCVKTIHWWPHVSFGILAETILTFSKNIRTMHVIFIQTYSPGTAQHLEALIVQCTRHQQTSVLAFQPSSPWPTGQGLLFLIVLTFKSDNGAMPVL